MAAERASALSHQLVAFARREVVQPHVIDLNKVIVDLKELLRRSIGEQFELVISMSPNLHSVKANPGQIQQVFVTSLVVNARDAIPDGGVVTIDTENVRAERGLGRVRDRARCHRRHRVLDCEP